MDVRGPHIVTHADISARGLHLDKLLTSNATASNPVIIGGRATPKAKGDSISQMMGTANGTVTLIMDGRAISELLLRKANVDIANSFLVLLRGDKNVPIRCRVANATAVEGDFKVQDLVLDTPKLHITGDGGANFADESLHLRLVSRSKTFSLASLRGPILVTGSFIQPEASPDKSKVAARGAAAVGLAAVTVGVAGLIPLLDFGDKTDSNCAAIIDQAGSDAGIKQNDIAQ